MGEAFQFGWIEEGMVVGGIYYRMHVSHIKLCASRAFWLMAYLPQDAGHKSPKSRNSLNIPIPVRLSIESSGVRVASLVS
jgi:hypothetical protein